jgi:hypothetical protein
MIDTFSSKSWRIITFGRSFGNLLRLESEKVLSLVQVERTVRKLENGVEENVSVIWASRKDNHNDLHGWI